MGKLARCLLPARVRKKRPHHGEKRQGRGWSESRGGRRQGPLRHELVSQREEEENGDEEARPRRHRKKQPKPDDYEDDVDGGEEIKHLYAMRKWAQEVPHEFGEGTMNMWRAKAAAYQMPVTITPKRKRKEVANDAMDGEDDQEDLETVGSESEPERDDTA